MCIRDSYKTIDYSKQKMDSQDYAPQFKVLLIANSGYDDESGFAPLPFVKTDLGTFRQFLLNGNVLTAANKPTLSHDDSQEDFT